MRRRAKLSEPLLDFVPRASPHLSSPRHLAQLAEAIERAQREEVFLLVSMPPQHGKTTMTAHGLVYSLLRSNRSHIYASYADQRARAVQVEAKLIAQHAGIVITGTQSQWRCSNGSLVRWAGAGSGTGGVPLSGIVFVDDPYPGMAEAQSVVYREKIETWFRSVIIARRHPGSSIIVVHTRWHPDDLIGTLQKLPAVGDRPWEVINFPAIMDEESAKKLGRTEGEALWPEKRPLDFLANQRQLSTPFIWGAEWLGQPRPRGMGVFQDTRTYDVYARDRARQAAEVVTDIRGAFGIPAGGIPDRARRVIGIDLAYTEKSYADYSAAVVLAESDGLVYVEHVERLQVAAPAFAATLRSLSARWPGARMLSFIGGTEKGVVDFLRQREGLTGLIALPAKNDKLMRAQPVAAAWNAGKVLVPDVANLKMVDRAKYAWVAPFVGEVVSFTGVGDSHDDQVDALAAGFHLLSRPRQTDWASLPGSF